MQTVRSKDGTTIAFRKSGTGPSLVLIHGGTADHTRWDPVLPQLQKRFTVYAVDRRGRGKSIDTGEYAIAREFEDIAAVVDSIGKPVYLLGHSFGGFCSLEAALFTDNISKLILYEPPEPGVQGTMPPGVAARMQELLDAGDRDGVVSTFMTEVALVPPHELDILRSIPAWQGRIAAAHTILREIKELDALPPFDPERYKSMKKQTLLLLGGDSPSEYGDFIRQIDAALPNSRIVVMQGQQHVAMNTAPELFVNEVARFLLDEKVELK
jgi:pimeloyl-ACP methyl ester carboxylesterase